MRPILPESLRSPLPPTNSATSTRRIAHSVSAVLCLLSACASPVATETLDAGPDDGSVVTVDSTVDAPGVVDASIDSSVAIDAHLDASAGDAAVDGDLGTSVCRTEFEIGDGILDVARCGVRPDGENYPCVTATMSDGDRTAAIRIALADARDHGWMLYFPPGNYTVTTEGDTSTFALDCHQLRSGGADGTGRHHPCVIVGSECGESRITLAASSHSGSTLLRLLAFDSDGTPVFNETFNNVVRSLVLDTTLAVDATALASRAAEGTVIHDLGIELADDGIGIEGGAGSGSSIANIRIRGGRVGLNYTSTGPNPTAFGATFESQREHAIVYAGWQTFVGAGIHIVNFRGTQAISSQGGRSDPTSMISLLDSVVEFDAPRADNTVVDIGRSTYLENVYSRNANRFAPGVPATSSEWSIARRVAFGATPQNPSDPSDPATTYPMSLSSRVWQCESGACMSSASIGVAESSDAPPADLAGIESRHTWPRAATFEAHNAVWVFAGSEDDQASLQAVIDSAGDAPIILGKGVFIVDEPIALHGTTRLFGLGTTISILEPDGRAGSAFHDAGTRCADDPSGQCPLLTTDDTAAGTTQLAYLGLYMDAWFDTQTDLTPITNVLPGADAYLLRWRSGEASSVRGVWTNGWGNALAGVDRVSGGLLRIEGGGQFYSLFAVANTFARAENFRAMVVTGSRTKRFYHVVPSHASSSITPAHTGAAMEIDHAQNVYIYGLKFESVTDARGCSAVVIHDSSTIRIHGHGGNGFPDLGRGLYHMGTGVSDIAFSCIVPGFQDGMRALYSRGSTVAEAAESMSRPAIVRETPENAASLPIGEFPAFYSL